MLLVAHMHPVLQLHTGQNLQKQLLPRHLEPGLAKKADETSNNFHKANNKNGMQHKDFE